MDKTPTPDKASNARPADAPVVSAGRGPRGPWALFFLALLAAVLFAGFSSLGIWQVKRLQWKLDLIEQVDARVHAPAVPAPGPDAWSATADETYLKVSLTGSFLPDETLVQATTDLGPGFWVLSPLKTTQGFTVLVNRGFVSPAMRDPALRPAEGAFAPGNTVVVTGLLRQSEPDGGFLRQNDPVSGRWYSRDVQAIARSVGLSGPVAPYFVDAAATPVGVWPVGGLTVIAFKNTHLVYALTWFALALMVAVATWYVARVERRLRRRAGHGPGV